jgi:hypothetical protein
VLEVNPEKLAVMFVESGRKEIREIVANPLVPGVLLMVATDVFDETHVTDAVKSCRLPSLNVPVAVNCCVVLPVTREMVGETGVTRIETSAVGVIVSVALLEVIPEKFAVMVVVPSPTDVARPFVPDVLLMVAMPGSDEFQATNDVMSGVLPSGSTTMAVYC